MSRGAGIGDGVLIIERGWGTASHMMHIMVSSIVMTIVSGRPNLSGALVDLVETGLAAAHGVVSCRLGLVVMGWALAGVTLVGITDVSDVGPAIIEIIVAFAVWRALGACRRVVAWGLVLVGCHVCPAGWWCLLGICLVETRGRHARWGQGRLVGGWLLRRLILRWRRCILW
jgi:hypothetical protein